jgi:hypothetical protein
MSVIFSYESIYILDVDVIVAVVVVTLEFLQIIIYYCVVISSFLCSS